MQNVAAHNHVTQWGWQTVQQATLCQPYLLSHKHIDSSRDIQQPHTQQPNAPLTGIPAEMPRQLMPHDLPHFLERKGKLSYHSERVLGQLYDQVIEHPALSQQR